MPRHWRQGTAEARKVVPLHPLGTPPRRRAPARTAALPLALHTRVTVRPLHDHPGAGEIRAVTRKARPVYDVLTDDGRYLQGLPADCVQEEQPS